jgi:myosin-crossreactive antigen
VAPLSMFLMEISETPEAFAETDGTRNSWALWKSLARGRNEFGHPEVFTDHIDQSRWVSFTVTCTDRAGASRCLSSGGVS